MQKISKSDIRIFMLSFFISLVVIFGAIAMLTVARNTSQVLTSEDYEIAEITLDKSKNLTLNIFDQSFVLEMVEVDYIKEIAKQYPVIVPSFIKNIGAIREIATSYMNSAEDESLMQK